jgi:hypothetical protein
MDDHVKPEPTSSEEEIPVGGIEKAVKAVAERKIRAFGPTLEDLRAKQAEIQRQKVEFYRKSPERS